MAGRGSGRKLMVYLLAMTRLRGLTPSIAHPPRERPLARAVSAGPARHHCRGSRVVLSLWGLSAYFLPQKLLCVVYCRKKTLNDRQSRRVNQQSHYRAERGDIAAEFRPTVVGVMRKNLLADLPPRDVMHLQRCQR